MERKSLDSISACELTINEMIAVRGGEGPTTVTPIKTGEGTDIIL